MNYIKIGGRFILAGMVFYILENCYFGWNILPESDLENTADNIARVLLSTGFFIYLLPIFELYEDSVRRLKLRQERKERAIIDLKKEFMKSMKVFNGKIERNNSIKFLEELRDDLVPNKIGIADSRFRLDIHSHVKTFEEFCDSISKRHSYLTEIQVFRLYIKLRVGGKLNKLKRK